MGATPVHSRSAFESLRSLAGKRARRESCELCGLGLPADHLHLLERSNNRIVCACDPCSILFSHREGNPKYLRVPRAVRRLAEFQMTDAEWSALMLPIDMAFFVNSSKAGRVMAFYPSPAGCTESLLSLEAWQEILRNNPPLGEFALDVEALLVNRTRGRRDCYIVPIDECYRLAGLIRAHWSGLSGGETVWEKIGEFFSALEERACRT